MRCDNLLCALWLEQPLSRETAMSVAASARRSGLAAHVVRAHDEASGAMVVLVEEPSTAWLAEQLSTQATFQLHSVGVRDTIMDPLELSVSARFLFVEAFLTDCTLAVSPGGVHGLTVLALHDINEAPVTRVFAWSTMRDQADIRNYYGDAIAFYFSWMDHYNLWLLAPAAAGALSTAIDVAFLSSSDSKNDNPLLPLFSLLIMFWAVLFVRTWERQQATLALRFGTLDLEAASPSLGSPHTNHTIATPRPQFYGEHRFNPFTLQPEIHYPMKVRLLWQLLSVCVTAFLLALALLVQMCCLNLQGALTGDVFLEAKSLSALAAPGALFDTQSHVKSWMPVLIQGLFIYALNTIYRLVASWLTECENYPTQAQHERAFIIKRVLFEFVDRFASLFYLAFYRRDIAQLQSELMSLFVLDQTSRLLLETVLPYITHWCWPRRTTNTETLETVNECVQTGAALPPVLQPQLAEELSREPYDSFDDFVEMLMQFGYVTLFASAVPLAALFALTSNLIEVNSDRLKLLYVVRKPSPCRSSGVDSTWIALLRGFAYISVMTNVAVFAYSSDQMRKMFPGYFDVRGDVRDGSEEYMMVALFALEHVVLLLVMLVEWFIPRVPYSVDSFIREEHSRRLGRGLDPSRRNCSGLRRVPVVETIQTGPCPSTADTRRRGSRDSALRTASPLKTSTSSQRSSSRRSGKHASRSRSR